MNSKSLRILEYNKIIEKLTHYASSEGGKNMCRNLLPEYDYNTINIALSETSDALSRVYANGSVSFSGTRDILPSVKRLEVGSTLSASELLSISSVLTVTNKVKAYSRKENEEKARDTLDDRFDALTPLTPLNNEINRCIISEEEISDDASPNLKNIRRQIKLTNDKIHSELGQLVNNHRSYLQENVVTMRNGRYCVPVKAEYKSQVSGMVHDQSSTGSTFFIEPMSIVKLNNDLRELAAKEKEEIDVILATLSASCGEYCEELKNNLLLLTELDFIFAKASYAKEYKCTKPVMNTKGYINLKKARHPLIEQSKVVPIDVYLGRDFNLLIITGPNTGGKTVTLKTIGLLTLMAQSGLFIPAFDNSELAIFREVFADIGDEQSIEQSLSTFSSHMTNIVKILETASDDTLCLFDELCAGTDPTEGAALATSILDFLNNMQIRTVATTHYSELKFYALTKEGVENACCEFNVETLSPTYRLLIGIPGKSNAFAISKKLGLPEFIINDASKRIGSDDRAFEDVIADLENSRVVIEKEREEIERYKKEVEDLKNQLEAKHDRLDERKDKIIKQANEEAARILREAKEYADESIKTFNKKGLTPQEMEAERTRLREKMNKAESKIALKNSAKASKKHSPKDFKIGTPVKVLSLNLTGTVSSLPNAKGDLAVQMGILRSQVNISDLEIIQETSPSKDTLHKTSAGKIKMEKTMSISPEINLIGLTVDEAMLELDKYLDDAYLSKIPQVRVVHGRGTGALRNAVHALLKRTRYVKNYRLGVYGEGDTGVTIVDFK